jgi:hypothetical protein
MKHKGYEITRVPYNIPHFPPTSSLAVIGPDGRAHLVANEETAEHLIDVKTTGGLWPAREGGGTPA